MQHIGHIQAFHDERSQSHHCTLRKLVDEFYDGYSDKHPAVEHTLRIHGRPHEQLLMAQQQPSLAEDNLRIAYYQSPEKQARNLHTVTTIGKYIKRFWPDLADHTIRDIAALFGPDEIVILDKMEDIINAIQKGPYSCMKWNETGSGSDREYAHEDVYTSTHPYHAYCPSLGWRLVVRRQGLEVQGRALINVANRDVFVRSYAAPVENNKYSETDQKIEAYLLDKGFKKYHAWPEGTKLLKVPFGNAAFIVPFLDPGSTEIESNGRNLRVEDDYLVRDDEGDFDADCTDGTYSDSDHSDRIQCEDCDDRMDSDECTYVGQHGSRCVCNNCMDNYTYVYGNGGQQYYIPDSEAITVDCESYDPRYLSDNNIIRLGNGDYCGEDDAIYIESESEYYHVDDIGSDKDTNREIVRSGDDEYELRDNCKWCHVNEEWYLEDEMTELNHYWVKDTQLQDHLMEMDLDDLKHNHPNGESVMADWTAYQHANNPDQLVLEMEGN